MLHKLLSLLACVAAIQAAAISNDDADASPVLRKVSPKDRVAALYLKEGNENGQLRFLAGNTGNSASLNALINQYITQQQNALESLRPTGTTATTGTTGTGLTSTTSTNGVTPIVVNLAGTSSTSTGTNSAVQTVINNSSPISSLLPQIIAQAVRQNPNQRNRVVNNRRRGGNRGGQRPQVFLIRP